MDLTPDPDSLYFGFNSSNKSNLYVHKFQRLPAGSSNAGETQFCKMVSSGALAVIWLKGSVPFLISVVSVA